MKFEDKTQEYTKDNGIYFCLLDTIVENNFLNYAIAQSLILYAWDVNSVYTSMDLLQSAERTCWGSLLSKEYDLNSSIENDCYLFQHK